MSCSNGDVRLSDGVNESEGRLEICYQGFWEPVCHSTFQPIIIANEINVCNQLGFDSGRSITLDLKRLYLAYIQCHV